LIIVIEARGDRTWPTISIEGHINRMPSFYIYLIDYEIDNKRKRIVTLGLTHWLLGIYAEVEIAYRIYPKFLNDNTCLYLSFVSYPRYGFKINRCEEYTGNS
jgi:hypothetical protein